jgi:TolB-like protein
VTGGPSIAVLPFRNLGDNNDDSFSDGLTDELIDSLATVPGLRVVTGRPLSSSSRAVRITGKSGKS